MPFPFFKRYPFLKMAFSVYLVLAFLFLRRYHVVFTVWRQLANFFHTKQKMAASAIPTITFDLQTILKAHSPITKSVHSTPLQNNSTPSRKSVEDESASYLLERKNKVLEELSRRHEHALRTLQITMEKQKADQDKEYIATIEQLMQHNESLRYSVNYYFVNMITLLARKMINCNKLYRHCKRRIGKSNNKHPNHKKKFWPWNTVTHLQAATTIAIHW